MDASVGGTNVYEGAVEGVPGGDAKENTAFVGWGNIPLGAGGARVGDGVSPVNPASRWRDTKRNTAIAMSRNIIAIRISRLFMVFPR